MILPLKMKLKLVLIFGIIIVVIITGVVSFLAFQKREVKETKPKESPISKPISKMKLASAAFSENQMIPQKYTCDGENVSPPLSISEAPPNTQSLVLIMDDPDAPGRTFVHWTMWNIDPNATEVPEGSVPKGAVEGLTDFGTKGYDGPCPPSGTHRYIFKLYALGTPLSISENSRKEDLEREMADHVLDFTQFIGLYSRSR